MLFRSGLAREKPEVAALNQNARVIVNDLREQARSHIWTVPALDFAFNTQAGREAAVLLICF